MQAPVDDYQYKGRVLRLSRINALVRYAACAAAAKQLGHIRDPKQFLGQNAIASVFTRRNAKGKIDFLWYGAKYYGKAIQAMATELSVEAGASFGMSPEGLPWSNVAGATHSQCQPAWIEARFVAAEIMCFYEELSASWRAWGRHLDGIFELLQAKETTSPAQGDTLEDAQRQLWQTIPQATLRHVVWRFALKDCEQSCKNTYAAIVWQMLKF